MTPPIHVLHIPKTGGTALQVALGGVPDGPFRFHGHLVRLADVPVGEKVIFAVRDPIRRFVSGFNSRLRKGQPRHYAEWSPIEEDGFKRFPTPNALAEALSAPDLEERLLATRLIRGIFHTGVPLSYWLNSAEYLDARRLDVLLVLWQHKLSADFLVLKGLLNLADDLDLPSDPMSAHSTPPGFNVSLSDRAEENLRAWYSGDLVLLDHVSNLRVEKLGPR